MAGVIVVVAILIIAAIGVMLVFDPFTPKRVPTPLSPLTGDTIISDHPSFSWSEVSGADRYQIVLTGQGDAKIMDEYTTTNGAICESSLEDGIYEWYVRAEVDGDWSDWSQSVTFFVGSDTINRHYEWEFDGRTWEWDMMIPASEYLNYSTLPRTYDYASYMTDDNSYIESLAQALNGLADDEGWSSFQLVSFTLSFVQSLEYTEDDVTTGYDEYPRYPVETLVDEGGDCEDSSVLFASLIQADPINIDAVLLILPADAPEHMAAGVAGGNGIHGVYYEYDGRNYYYCETTGEGWMLGDIPPQYTSVTVEIIQV